jgi:hypothetical protein
MEVKMPSGRSKPIEELANRTLYSYEDVAIVVDICKNFVLAEIVLKMAAELGERSPAFLADYIVNVAKTPLF